MYSHQHQHTYPLYPSSPVGQHLDGNEYHGSHRPSTPSSSGAPSLKQSGPDKPLVRRGYHPNPPAHRSEWVMWMGNVPSDTGHDELLHFLTRPLDEGASGANNSDAASAPTNGVLSIFPIPRSCCAFVNYETEAQRDAATERFNGVPLRADPRCPLLVCRARRKDDDLRAGVGGQRGMGMHSRWLSALSIDDVPTRPPPRPLVGGSNSSGSHASTDSSLLRQHFPQRFFILKSLTRDDLDLSTQTGMWATQKHNEGILDRAFRTSQDVFLIFSVNKSGEFYGYARERGEGWGQEFKLEWLCTERLPFRRTRHIRNPWNRDREVKISRDGTELEPQVGRALLEEWRLYLAEEGMRVGVFMSYYFHYAHSLCLVDPHSGRSRRREVSGLLKAFLKRNRIYRSKIVPAAFHFQNIVRGPICRQLDPE
ncbi:YT521-B-like domain-containing protein [Mycena capillaripes]|nr:YT521-B-like domain-containing protein [Mycena capillaripes]